MKPQPRMRHPPNRRCEWRPRRLLWQRRRAGPACSGFLRLRLGSFLWLTAVPRWRPGRPERLVLEVGESEARQSSDRASRVRHFCSVPGSDPCGSAKLASRKAESATDKSASAAIHSRHRSGILGIEVCAAANTPLGFPLTFDGPLTGNFQSAFGSFGSK